MAMTATSLEPMLGKQSYQKKAWERLLQLGLPEEQTLSSAIEFMLPQVPSSIVALPLSKAWQTYAAYLEKRWALWLEKEKDLFALLTAALDTETLFLYIPPNVKVEKPLQLQAPRALIHVGAGVQVEIRACCTFCDLQIEEGACATVEREIDHQQMLRATLKRDATFKSVAFVKETKYARDDYHIQLAGENGNAKLFGLGLLMSGSHEAHTHILMEHIAPHTNSLQTFKAVVGEPALSTFEGKIYVHKKAQKTQAYQISRHLLLSPKARAKSKPNLEIFADDVKASHGATVGQLDDEAYFYLLSRGIDRVSAKKLLIDAFCKEVVDESLAT